MKRDFHVFKNLIKITLIVLGSLFSIDSKAEFVERKSISLELQSKYNYPNEVFAAYLLGKEGPELEVKVLNNRVLIQANRVSKKTVQILEKTGKIVNLTVQVTPRFRKEERSLKSSNSYKHKGHQVRFSTFYEDRFSNKKSVLPFNYGFLFDLYTKVGDDGKFSTRLDYREASILYYYLRLEKKKFYIAHGDNTIISPEIMSNYLSRVRLRSYEAGYSGDFYTDVWTGQFSPVINPSEYIMNSSSSKTAFDNTYKDWFSGARVGYKQKKYSIFATYWNNPKKSESLPQVGGSVKLFNDKLFSGFSVANNPEKPIIRAILNFNNKVNDKWTLQRARLDYDVAPKGVEDLFFSSVIPKERLILDFYFLNNTQATQEKGSIFVQPGFLYNLDGVAKFNEYRMNLGWRNSNLMFYSNFNYGVNDSTIPLADFTQKTINPGFDFWLNSKKSKVRYKLDVSQSFINQEDSLGNSQIKREETVWGITAHTNSLSARFGMGRIYTKNSNNTDRAAYRINPSINYNSNKLDVGIFANYLFNEEEYDAFNSERFGAKINWSPNKNHTIGVTASQIKDSINRDNAAYKVSYTFRFGDDKKSIIEALDSKKIKLSIFEDLNNNKVKEEEEKSFAGIKIRLVGFRHKQEGETNSDGEVSLSGFEDQKYQIEIDPSSLPEDYLMMETLDEVDFSIVSSLTKTIRIQKIRKVQVTLNHAEEEIFQIMKNCKNLGITNELVKTNTENLIFLPKEDECSLEVSLFDKKNIGIDKNNVLVEKNISKVVFNLKTTENYIGQIFFDKNNNGIFDLGEEMKKVPVIFNKMTVYSDENGYWFVKNSSKIKGLVLKTPSYQGLNCRPKFKEKIAENNGQNILQIMCIKK